MHFDRRGRQGRRRLTTLIFAGIGKPYIERHRSCSPSPQPSPAEGRGSRSCPPGRRPLPLRERDRVRGLYRRRRKYWDSHSHFPERRQGSISPEPASRSLAPAALPAGLDGAHRRRDGLRRREKSLPRIAFERRHPPANIRNVEPGSGQLRAKLLPADGG
jgi:hypothetical protein